MTPNDPHARRVLRQFLETDQLLGVDAVPVATRARLAPSAAASPRQASAPTSSPSTPAGHHDDPMPSPSPHAPVAIEKAEPTDRDTKLRLLSELDANEVRNCTRCRLSESRTQTVFGEGDVDARILFIGEGPGQTEDETGRPFVGRAGELLTKMITAMGFSRESVYIANVVKCRPPENRTPQADEVDACREYLLKQVAWIHPEAIVTLGGPAAKLVLGTKEGITRIRGKWSTFDEVDPPIPVMPTFHPAYLLRNYTPDTRKKVWSDLCAVLDRLGLTPPAKREG
mgnify:FL=1